MDLWQLAQQRKSILTWSTLIPADAFRRGFGSDEDIKALVRWCHDGGVARVFVENFRGGYFAEDDAVRRVGEGLRDGGVEAAGGVTTNGMHKRSTGWNIIGCYTDEATCDQLQQSFEQAARLFDLIMIDDFYFTDCECEQCVAARGERTWPRFRMDLMHRLAVERVIGPARKVNPNVKLILKYPQWYDRLHVRGYDVERLTELFDYTWAGTELRDPDHTDPSVPNVRQTQGQFVMRWMMELGGGKCGGGWFDCIATSPDTYLEQAWQTILGGAPDALLFNYRSFAKPGGQANLEALKPEMPALFELAEYVQSRQPAGVVTPKPASSDPGDGRYVFDHLGMLGVPMRPVTKLGVGARSAFVSAENLADADIAGTVNALLDAGCPVVATDGLLNGADGIRQDHEKLLRLDLNGRPTGMLEFDEAMVRRIREHLLRPLGLSLEAPIGVGTVMLGDDMLAVSNFRPEPSRVKISGEAVGHPELLMRLPGKADVIAKAAHGEISLEIPPRSLALVRLAS